MNKKLLIAAVLMLVLTVTTKAQINMPQPSPTATFAQKVGLTDVTFEYARPSKKGRDVFGGLVPYGQIWRTGANASTKIEFSDDVMLEGNKVPAGKYALYTIPGEKEWTIIVHKNTSHWGVGNYDESEDLVRFKVNAGELIATYETFTIGIDNVTDESATIYIAWENTWVPIKMTVEIDEKVMADIKAKLQVNPNNYYQAASYYLAHDKDMNQAMEWINMAIEARSNAYWMHHVKAKIAMKMGDKKTAKAAANKSIEYAKKAGNNGYVRLNEELLSNM